MKCIFHIADLDGRSSGAIVKNKYPQCEMIPYDYGQEFPWDLFGDRSEEVFMVDVSLPVNTGIGGDMMELDQKSNLIWIDHHKTAIDDAEINGFNPKGTREIGRAACELTWEYLNNTNMPKSVLYLGMYDTWRHNDDPDILGFQYGLKLTNPLPDNPIWRELFSSDFNNAFMKATSNGKLIMEYERVQNEVYANTHAFKTELEGYPAIAINKGCSNSKIFDTVYKGDKYCFMILFSLRNKGEKNKWQVSLYSSRKDINVGEIAKKHGGGGHAGAAGFICEELPFSIF